MNITDKKVAKFEREVWYEYAINTIPKGIHLEYQEYYLSGIVKSIRRNYGVSLKERIGYLGLVRKKLEEIRK